MKKLIIALLVLKSSFANIVKESLFVHDPLSTHLQMIRSNPDLTVDHLNDDGYELYGPNGTSKWLKQIGIDHDQMIFNTESLNGYPKSDEIISQLRSLASANPEIIKLIKIGESEKGQDLVFLKISDNPHIDELEPEVKLMANMHGDEIMGREILLQFLEDLVIEYRTNPEVKSLIDNTELFVMPTMNPDGADRRRRGNANYVDLNRSFPDFTRPGDFRTPPKEVKAMMDFQKSRNFALSFNYHGGAVVVNYPWDTHDELHPENDLIVDLSKNYVQNTGYFLTRSRFKDAITNGYQWYEVNGGMQDWSYHWYNDLQVTIEVSKRKWPNYRDRTYFYNENKEAIFNYIKSVHRGTGISLPHNTKIKVNTINGEKVGEFQTYNNEFYKVLAPGDYKLNFRINGTDKELELQISEELKYRNFLKL